MAGSVQGDGPVKGKDVKEWKLEHLGFKIMRAFGFWYCEGSNHEPRLWSKIIGGLIMSQSKGS